MLGKLTEHMTKMPLVEALPGDFLDCFEDAAIAAARNVDLADPRIAPEDPGFVVIDNKYDQVDDDIDDDDNYHSHGHDMSDQIADHRSEEGDAYKENEQSEEDNQDKQNEDNNHTEGEIIGRENISNIDRNDIEPRMRSGMVTRQPRQMQDYHNFCNY